MSSHKISRNDPCPCGSGKKFKNCCIGKDIDWDRPKRPPLSAAKPRSEPPPPFFPGAFVAVDAKLKEIARTAPAEGTWKPLVERLSPTTSETERIAAYKAIRDAGVLTADAAFFLFGHAIQWIPPQHAGDDPVDEEDEEDDDLLDRHMAATFRRFGLDDLADLYTQDRLAFDRRHECGREFFFGPPDELLTASLKAKGIID